MKSYESLSPQTPEWVHIHPKATQTLSLRLTPKIRQSIEGIAVAQNSSPKVALRGFEMLYAAKQRESIGETLSF